MLEILDEIVLHSSETGTYKRVRRWIRGWHAELGSLIWGITGKETIIETDVVRPIGKFHVMQIMQVAA